MRQYSHLVGPNEDCLKLIDWLISMEISYKYYELNDTVSVVKFLSPFIGKQQYHRKAFELLEDY